MKQITDNFQCPIFRDHKIGFCLRWDCPVYKLQGNVEYCRWEEYKLLQKTEHPRGYKLRKNSKRHETQ